MRPWILAILTPLLLFVAGVRAEEAPKASQSAERMVFGTVYGGSVYTAEATQAFDKGDFTGGGVTVTRIDLYGEEPWIDFPPRWKIGNGRLAVIHAEFPPFAPGIYKRDIFLTTLNLDKISEKSLRRQPAGSKYDFVCRVPWGAAGEGDALIGCAYEEMRGYINDKYHVMKEEDRPFSDYEFFYDLTPIKPEGWAHFVLASESLQQYMDDSPRLPAHNPPVVNTEEPSRGAHRTFWWTVKEPLKPVMGVWYPDKHYQWALADQIKGPAFDERFHAFTKGSTYFFLTDSGKVYVSKKPDQGDRKMEVLWDNDHYPVTAALEDADAGKVFLFGKARKGDGVGKDFYWELGETVHRHDYDPALVKPIDTLEPLKTVMEYARFLADQKEIQLPDKGGKEKDK